jgi:hypothetical protein
MTSEIAIRVARRFTAGILEAPPAMHAAIMEWIQAVLAANRMQSAQQGVDRMNETIATQGAALEKLKQAAQLFKAAPTWKSYTPVYEQLWVFGHPGARWSAKDFQKLTPEKKAELQQRADGLLSYIEERSAGLQDHYRDSLTKASNELQEAARYAKPGVEAMTAKSIVRRFPVDLTGWKHNTKSVLRMLGETMGKEKAQAQAMYDRLKGMGKPESDDIVQLFLQKAQSGFFADIDVELTAEESDKFAAFWEPARKRVQIIVPEGAQPRAAERLSRSLAHELRHFVQSYLAYAVGLNEWSPPQNRHRPGFPSRKIQTPQYKQEFDPSHPGYKPGDSELAAITKRLQDRGIDPRNVDWHSLDDVEFYTKLPDSIDAFQDAWVAHGSPAILNDAIRLWTGAVSYSPSRRLSDQEIEKLGGLEVIKWFKPDKFFVALRRGAPGKWRKAVSELVKAVT